MPTLEITTTLGCSLACRFCPQGRLVKSYPSSESRSLTLSEFKHVVEKLPVQVRVDFAGMAEPWLNAEATAMVDHAFQMGRKVAIYTTLQGMTPRDAALLTERYADRIAPEMPWVIHLPDREGNMTGWRPHADYLKTLALFVALKRERAPPGLSFMTMDAQGRVAEALRPVIGETLGPFVGVSRVENLDRHDFSPGALLDPVRHSGALLCGSSPFFDHNTMLPNGDVVLCCMDYSRRHVLGNLIRQTYAELFTGAEMSRVRARAMGVDDADLICRVCSNAACLSQGEGTHWQLQRSAYWTEHLAAASETPTSDTAPVTWSAGVHRRRWLRNLMRHTVSH